MQPTLKVGFLFIYRHFQKAKSTLKTEDAFFAKIAVTLT
jgi:hypothetical protein